uniref:Uncharacterized protein n=1 Tax=Lepeophtheirus salmonis TaxID=72036 RepID=A0A0K2UVP4_LEPSM
MILAYIKRTTKRKLFTVLSIWNVHTNNNNLLNVLSCTVVKNLVFRKFSKDTTFT